VFGLASGTLVWLASTLAWGLPLAYGLPLLVILLGSTTFSLMGVLISVVVREVFDAMTLSNFFRFPMVFLSGVFLPVGAMAAGLRVVSLLLPLTYTVDALRHSSLGGAGTYLSLGVDLLASALFAAALYLVSFALMSRRLEELI
jgi:ABC-2 type transport system permease protein